jgi:hypothetical protein
VLQLAGGCSMSFCRATMGHSGSMVLGLEGAPLSEALTSQINS